jgi:aryl-alcohol dehydrogenase-like predicted oxidoreductase
LLQRDIEADVVPWCRRHGVSLMVYWPLMKGLLAGTIRRDHVFDPRDPRLQYPIFQRPEWDRHHDFIATLGEIAARLGRTVAQVTVNWTIHRPGITAALCGATRPAQIEDCAAAMHWELDEQALSEIEAAYQRWSAATHRLEPSPGA